MSVINSLVVNLGANTAQFNSGLKEASTGLTGFAGQISGLNALVSTGTRALGLMGLSFAGLFVIRDALDAAAGKQQTMAKLNAVLESTGHAAGYTSEQMQAMAKDLASVTTFSKGTIVSAETVLATFKEIKGDTFKQAMVAAEDLSTVMGQDLQSSVVQIGKALNAPETGLKALTRVGVSFTEQQKEQIKAMMAVGDVAGAQKIIIGELTSEFGGAAAAAGAGYTGQLIRLQNQIKGLKTAFGELLMPVAEFGIKLGSFTTDKISGIFAEVKRMKQALLDLLDSTGVSKFAGIFGYLGEKVLQVGAAIGIAIGAMKAFALVQRSVAAGLAIVKALSGPKGWIELAAGVAIATGALVAINTKFDAADGSAKAAAASTKAMGSAGTGLEELTSKATKLKHEVTAASDAMQGLMGVDTKLTATEAAADKTLAQLEEQIATFGLSGPQAEVTKLALALEKLRGDAGLSGTEAFYIDEAKAAAAKLDVLEKEKKLREEILALEESVATIGMNDAQKKLHEINKLATETNQTDIAKAAGLQKQFDEKTAAKKASDDQEHAAKELAKSTRTPFEKFQEEVDKMRALLDKGLIEPDVLTRGVDAAQKQLFEGLANGDKSSHVAGISALEKGTAAAFAAEAQSQQVDKGAELAQKQIDEAKKITENTKKTAELAARIKKATLRV